MNQICALGGSEGQRLPGSLGAYLSLSDPKTETKFKNIGILYINYENIMIFHDNMKRNNRIMHSMTSLQCKNGQNIGALGEFPKGP